jgi:hypothetical protein
MITINRSLRNVQAATSDTLGGEDVIRSRAGLLQVSLRISWVPVALALSFVLLAQAARAQSTIFNIPSTDVVDKAKTYLEFDFLPQAPGPDNGSATTIYNPRVVFGVGHSVEVGLNFPIYHNSDWDPTSLGYIQPDLKWKFFQNDKGVATSAGFVVNVPLNAREGQGTWSYIYGNVSKKWMGDHGPRLTVGPYGVIADQDSGKSTFIGTRGGVLVGYEQPLGGRLSFVADWFSGKNTIGYFTPGISISLPHSGLFNAGYSIGNDVGDETPDYKNRFLFFYYGVTF